MLWIQLWMIHILPFMHISAQSVPPPAWTTRPPKPRNQVWAEQVMSRHLINMTDNLIRDLHDKYEFARTVQDSYKHSKSYELGYLAAGVQELFKTMLEIYRTYSHLEDFKNGRYSVPEYVDAYQVVQGHYNDLRAQKRLYYEALDKYKQRHEAREEFFAVLNHHCPANKKRFKKVPDVVLQDNREIIHNLKAYKVIHKCEDEGATRKAVRKVRWPGWRRQFSYYPGRESLLESMNKPPVKNVWFRNNTDFSHIDRIAF